MDEDRRIVFPCELSLLMGLLLVSFAVCLFIRSGYGVTVLASIPLMLSYVEPAMDFGTWNIVYQFVLICIAIAITRRPNLGYLISMAEGILFGIFLNLMKSLLSGLPYSFELSIVYLVVAHVLLFFGVSFFMRAYIPLLPCDLFIRDVVITYRIKYRNFKTAFDIFCMVTSALIGVLMLGGIVDIGVGTLISAFVTGYFVSKITVKVYDRYFEFRPLTRFCAKYLSDDAPCKSEINT
jgi:uncharacterized membrane protein YczE